MRHRPVCVKCKLEMRPETNGVGLLDMFNPPDKPEPQPYQVWDADLWKCPECGCEIVVGFGEGPVARHFEANGRLAKAIQRYRDVQGLIESSSERR